MPRAQDDVKSIVSWLAERSVNGASAWLDAYHAMIETLSRDAATFGPADEAKAFDEDIRQVLFKTRFGRAYRALYVLDGEKVYLLRVRGPGQAPVPSDDVE